ncbi:MAG: hypothetical protein AAGI01_15135, partial [Myxococcota bacterium]
MSTESSSEPTEAPDEATQSDGHAAEEPALRERFEQGYIAIEESVGSTREHVTELNAQAVHFIQNRPLAALGIAFGV